MEKRQSSYTTNGNGKPSITTEVPQKTNQLSCDSPVPLLTTHTKNLFLGIWLACGISGYRNLRMLETA